METNYEKTCKCCGRVLPLSNFKHGRWGYVSVCNDCDKEHRKQNRAEREKAAAEAEACEKAEKRQLCLRDFSPRELMEELARRGYTGKLEYIEKHVIDISSF